MLLALAVVGSAPEGRAEPQRVSGVAAVVDVAIVPYGEVLTLSRPAEQLLARQYLLEPEVLQRKVLDVHRDNREELIQRQLVLHDFEVTFGAPERKAVVDKLIRKDVDQEVETEIRTRYGGSRISLIQTLQAQGITMERHRQQIRDRIIINWLRQKNISSEIIVSPRRIEVYYLAHREEFKVEDEVKLRMIVLKCPGESEVRRIGRLAEDILREIKGGATFAEMASVYSEGSQRNQGGDLGWWEPSRLSKGLADTALALQPGQHSGVLSRSAGSDYWVCQYDNGAPTLARHYVADTALKKENMVEERRLESASTLTNLPPPIEFFLMLVEDKRPARYKTLVEVRDQIEKDLVATERSRLEKQYVDRLEKKSFVRRF